MRFHLNTSRIFRCIACALLLLAFTSKSVAAPIESGDSINVLKEQNLLKLIDTTAIHTTIVAPPINPAQVYETFNRLLLPLTFDEAFPEDCWRIERRSMFENTPPAFDSIEIRQDSALAYYFAIDSLRKEIHHRLIFDYPEWVEGVRTEPEDDLLTQKMDAQRQNKELLQMLYAPEVTIPTKISAKPLVQRINQRGHWFFLNKATAQFSQNYISGNWQQGGESNLAMNNTLNMKANYLHPRGWIFNNELEWRSSFFTAPSDTVRSWRVSDDLFRISSNLGLKAFEKWSYSISSEFKTRLFNSFKPNSNTKLGSFFSPAEFSFGLGMSFESDFDKLDIKGFSLLLSPYSYNWKYVLNPNVDVTRFGITKGQQSLEQIGSRWDMRGTYNIRKNISWTTRFYYFTTYENVESEWENTFNFVINRLFSTRVFFHIKYDDKRKLAAGEKSYFQFKELLSFGLNYIW